MFDARRFFITSYLNYQNQVLVKVVNTLLPLTKILSFTVPWLFESNLKDILPFLSKDITIIDWDYNLDNERVTTLAKRMNEYQSRGYEIWFMPSAGFSFSKDISEIDQINGVHAQIEAAEASDVAGIIHFLGPKISDYLIQTSRKYLNELKTNKHSP